VARQLEGEFKKEKQLEGEFKKEKQLEGECKNAGTLNKDRCKKLDYRVNCTLAINGFL
jgi:hypothetical protein